MIVRLIDGTSPRSDGRPGGPTDVTVGKCYRVGEICENGTQYSIIDDKFKLTRRSIHRFEVVDPTPPLPLRQEFNLLTLELRMKYKELLGESNANS